MKSVMAQLLRDGVAVEITAYGISMYPLLWPGDKLFINPTTTFERGDIVVFERADKLVAHRLIRLTDDNALCKGDSLLYHDQLISRADVLGVVTSRTRSKTVSTSQIQFRLAKALLPSISWLTGYFFFLCAVAHQKYLRLKKGTKKQSANN